MYFFHFSTKKSLEIKKHLENSVESTLRYCKLKSFSNLHLNLSKIIILKMCFLKTLFTMEKKIHCYIRAAEHTGLLYSRPKHLKNVKQSANSDHLLTRDCNTNFNDFTIVSKIPIILIYLSRKLVNIL